MAGPVAPLRAAPLMPSRYGLLNSKTLVDDGQRWEVAFNQETEACNMQIRLLDICSTSVTASAVEPAGDRQLGEFRPFAVQTTVKCSTAGFGAHDYVAQARRALEVSQGKGIELEFWEGKIAQAVSADNPGNPSPNKYLADSDAVDLTPTPGTAIKVRHGLAILEKAIGDTSFGGAGTIHVTRDVASALPIRDKDDDGIFVSPLGNMVIAGTGYTGVGPSGSTTPSGGVWMYATGPVFVRLGDVTVTPGKMSQSVDTGVNSISVSAERPAAVVWDGCIQYAVLVDLSLDYA